MINGANKDNNILQSRYITQHELAPVIEKVENLSVDSAIAGVEIKHLREDFLSMEKKITNIHAGVLSVSSNIEKLIDKRDFFRSCITMTIRFAGYSGLSLVILKYGEELFKLIFTHIFS